MLLTRDVKKQIWVLTVIFLSVHGASRSKTEVLEQKWAPIWVMLGKGMT